MKVSVELTLMPLQEDYETPIKSFIKKIRASGFVVVENPLSTQVYGEYAELIKFLSQEIQSSFEDLDAVVLNMKIVKTDRSNYESDF